MMEGIVYGIANINFQQNLEFRDENCTPNYISMASSAENFPQSHEEPTENTHHIGDASCPRAASVDDNSWEETDNDEDSDGADRNKGTCENKGLTFSERRQLPSRMSKEKSFLGSNRRTIMKPTKRVSSVHKDFNSLKPHQLKKLYTNKKLTKFTPTSLETIIEESPDIQINADVEDHNNHIKFLGTRKLRRTVTFTDCLFVNKALIKKRRAKIKKVIGRRPALKKISLEEFMHKLNSSMEEKPSTHTPSEDMDEGYCHIETLLTNRNVQDSLTSSLTSAHDGAVTEETMVLPSASTHEAVNKDDEFINYSS